MLITDIRPLKSGNFALYADGEYAASIDDETLTKSGISRGTEISGQDFEEIVSSAAFRKAKQKALRILAVRDHTSSELIKKLQPQAGEEAAEKAAERMRELGFIDDERYAGKFAAELMRHKFYSRNRAVYELRRKGIDRELAEEAVDALEIDPLEQIEELLRKKFPRGIESEKDRRRASSLLSRYGYSWDNIRQAMQNYMMEDEDAD